MEFVAAGTPQVLARAIEDVARTHGSLSALVVPWESSRTTLSMAVTSVKTDGWAIEHLNLGTITLSDLGNDRTRIAITACEPAAENASPAPQTTLAAAFERFARQIQTRFLDAGARAQ